LVILNLYLIPFEVKNSPAIAIKGIKGHLLSFFFISCNSLQMKHDITNLEDIILFVDEFYNKVKDDDLLGPIFNSVIKDWQPHLEKMYKFWNAALFSVPGFKGNPFARHAPLPISGPHFDRWMELFTLTIDEHFEGKMADDVKNRAALMANMFLDRLQGIQGAAHKVIV
jgi:hemoglobin